MPGPAIKERNIAVDVFGKGPDFDSQTDSAVASKRRKCEGASFRHMRGTNSAAAFESNCRRADTSRYSTFPGGLLLLVLETTAVLTRWRWPSLQGPWPWIMLTVTLLTLVAVAAARISQPRSSIDLLWLPFTRQPQPVLISLPAPTVLEIQNKAKWLPLRDDVSIPSADLQQMDSYYVGVGAAQGAARFAEQLALRRHAFILKFGDDVSFADLRQSPAILLGAFTSHWTMELTKHLPFQLTGAGTDRIVDSIMPGRSWQSDPPSSQSEPRTGYALITRLLRSDSGNLLLMASGIGAHDTQAAVDFLSHEEYFDQFASQSPNWARRNFQIVVRSPIHGHTPGPPTAVAWRAW